MRELPEAFEGRGEVKGFMFHQAAKTPSGYVYRVRAHNSLHYEVFKRKENKRFNVVSYPRGVCFGRWAWTCSTFGDAHRMLMELSGKHPKTSSPI